MNIKAYWKSIFIDNWQTTSVGLTTMISTAINYAWLWRKEQEMPSPEGYVVPFLAALFLVFRAVDPGKQASAAVVIVNTDGVPQGTPNNPISVDDKP